MTVKFGWGGSTSPGAGTGFVIWCYWGRTGNGNDIDVLKLNINSFTVHLFGSKLTYKSDNPNAYSEPPNGLEINVVGTIMPGTTDFRDGSVMRKYLVENWSELFSMDKRLKYMDNYISVKDKDGNVYVRNLPYAYYKYGWENTVRSAKNFFELGGGFHNGINPYEVNFRYDGNETS